jgi:hypothetical protein
MTLRKCQEVKKNRIMNGLHLHNLELTTGSVIIIVEYNFIEMLILLPFLTWIFLLLIWLDDSRDKDDNRPAYRSIRASILCVTITCGAILALMSEGLSLIHALNREGVALGWVAVLLILCVIGLRGKRFEHGFRHFWKALRQIGKGDWALIGFVCLLSAALLLIVLLSPPNTSDSMKYHLSRVMHWAQDASLQHYATAFLPQLDQPIWAEEAILHLRLLWGDDRFAGFVQFAAMLVSLVGVTLIAARLGAGKVGQWLAAAFAFSVPIGVLQATSTQNDYVVALWLVCTTWLVIEATREPFNRLNSLLLGLAVGLGMLTKGTFYPYVVPLGIWFLVASVIWIRHSRLRFLSWMRKFIQTLLIVIICIVFINFGYWFRNILTFNGPLGPSEFIKNMTADQFGIGPLVTGLIKNTMLNFVTPSIQINATIVKFLQAKLLPLDPGMQSFNMLTGWNHEDLAGNPLHLILVVVAAVILVLKRKQLSNRSIWAYFGVLAGMFIMLAVVVHFDIYGVRYQLPLFILGASFFGAALNITSIKSQAIKGNEPRTKLSWYSISWVLVAFLLIAALPWVVFNRTRPLIALKNGGDPFSIPCQHILGCTPGSILSEPPTTTLFTNWHELRDPYMKMTADLKKTGCQQIGLRLDSIDSEYYFWWLLNAPQSGRRLETIYATPDTQRYIDPAFHPCAVICTTCSGHTSAYGLPLFADYSNWVQLYIGQTYSPQFTP